MRLVPSNIFKPSSNYLTDCSKAVLLLWIFLAICVSCLSVILSCLFLRALSSPARKRADLLSLLYVMFSCVFVTFPYGVLDHVWNLIVSIPDLCLLPYLLSSTEHEKKVLQPRPPVRLYNTKENKTVVFQGVI